MCQVDKLCKQVKPLSPSPSLTLKYISSLPSPSLPTHSTLFLPCPLFLNSAFNYSLPFHPLFAMQKICIIFRQSKNWKQLSHSTTPIPSLPCSCCSSTSYSSLFIPLSPSFPFLCCSPLLSYLSLLFPLVHAAHGTSRLDRRVAWQLLHSNNKKGARQVGEVECLAAISPVAKNIRICREMLEERPHFSSLPCSLNCCSTTHLCADNN